MTALHCHPKRAPSHTLGHHCEDRWREAEQPGSEGRSQEDGLPRFGQNKREIFGRSARGANIVSMYRSGGGVPGYIDYFHELSPQNFFVKFGKFIFLNIYS